MRLVFFGTPAFAVPTLRGLNDAGHEIALAVTQPDRRRGRGTSTAPSPVKAAALELGIPISHRPADAAEAAADLGVLVAYGRLIKPPLLDALRILNLHPSLLPRWRGATPVEAAILAGDEETGVCVMELVAEMDAGPVLRSATTVIEPGETSTELGGRLFAAGTTLLLDLLGAQPLPDPRPQHGEISYCGKLTPEDRHLDWSKPAGDLDRVVRIGQAWTTFRGKRLKVLATRPETATDPGARPGSLVGTAVASSDGILRLVTVQPEGKSSLPAEAWANGARLQPDDRLV